MTLDPNILAMDPVTDPEFWRGAVASLNWQIREETLRNADDWDTANERPTDEQEPSPSQFWAGWREVDDGLHATLEEMTATLAVCREKRRGIIIAAHSATPEQEQEISEGAQRYEALRR